MENISKQQANKLAATLVEFQDEFMVMPKDDGQWSIQNTKAAIALFIEAVKNRKRDSGFITYLSASTLPAATEKFVVRDHFWVNTSKNAKVKISLLDHNFRAHFIDKVEEAVPERALHGYTLIKRSLDKPILKDLGGKEKVKTTLRDIWIKMCAQPNGEAGELRNDGYANIFYVEDVDSVLLAVLVLWNSDGWIVVAISVEDQNEWNTGSLVFSRNSALKPSNPAPVSENAPESDTEQAAPA